MSTTTAPRHVRPGRLSRLFRREDRPAAFPARKPGGEKPGGPLFTSASGHSIYPSDVCAACLDGRCAACPALSAPGELCWCTHPGAAPVTGDTEAMPAAEQLEPLPMRVPLAALAVPPPFRTASSRYPARPGIPVRLADSLRSLDGPADASRDYRKVRGHLETVPFRAVQDEEPPEAAPEAAPEPACSPPRSLAADLTDLPAFREAVSMRTRGHARQCMCGDGLAGDRWGERMVAAGAHLLGGAA